ncbi:hypothetical protein Droror1_Dr00012075 [Drosera rotundifolia]
MAAISTLLHSSVPITPKYLSALRIQLLASTPSNDGKSSRGNWGGWGCCGEGSFWRYGGVLNGYCGGTNGNPLEVEAREMDAMRKVEVKGMAAAGDAEAAGPGSDGGVAVRR